MLSLSRINILAMGNNYSNAEGRLYQVTLTDVDTGEVFTECFRCGSPEEAETMMRNRICWAEGCFVSVKML